MLVRAIRLTERFSQFWTTNRRKSTNVRRRGPVAPILTLSFAGPGSPDYRPGSSADGSAPALGAGGRGFKSRLPDHRPTTTPAGVAQWLESQPSKLAMRVRFPSPAPHVSAGQTPLLARAERAGAPLITRISRGPICFTPLPDHEAHRTALPTRPRSPCRGPLPPADSGRPRWVMRARRGASSPSWSPGRARHWGSECVMRLPLRAGLAA